MPIYVFGACRFDSETRLLEGSHETVELKPKIAEVLHFMVQRPQEVISKETLLDEVWADVMVTEGSLTKTMTELRQALGDSARNPIYIKTVLKKGYIWIHEVTVAEVVRQATASATPAAEEPEGDSQRLLQDPAKKSPVMLISALILLGLAVVMGLMKPERPAAPNDATPPEEHTQYLPTVAVLPFQTRSAEDMTWLQTGLRDLVCKELEDLGGLDLIALGDLEKVLAGHDKNQAYDQDLIQSIQTTFKPTYVLQAEVTRDPQGYHILFVIRDLEGQQRQHRVAAKSIGKLAKLTSYSVARKMKVAVGELSMEDPNSFAMQSYAQGMHFFENHDYQKAVHHFIVSLDNEPTMAWARFQMARARYNMDEQREAARLFQLVIEESRLYANPILEAKALRYHALVDRHLTNWPEAISHTEQALTLFRSLDHLSGVVTAQNQLATIHAQKGDLDSAIDLLNQSRGLIGNLNNPFVASQTLIKYGTVLSMKGKLQEAQTVFDEALVIVRDLKDVRNEAAILNNLGNIANLRGHLEQASQHYEAALKNYQIMANKNGQARTLLNLGVIAASMEAYENSNGYYQQALPVAQAVGNRYLETVIINSLGANALKFDHLDEARRWLIQGQGLARQLGAESLVVDASCLLARIHLRQDQIKQAEQQLLGLEGVNNALLQTTQALLAYAQGNFDKALAAQQAGKLAAGEKWSPMDQRFLQTFEQATAQKTRLKLPSPHYLPQF